MLFHIMFRISKTNKQTKQTNKQTNKQNFRLEKNFTVNLICDALQQNREHVTQAYFEI